MSSAENTENFQGEEPPSEDATNKATAFIKQYQLTLREVDVLSFNVIGDRQDYRIEQDLIL